MIIDQILPQTFFPLCWFPKFSFPSTGEIGALYPISFPHFRLSKLFPVLCSSSAVLAQDIVALDPLPPYPASIKDGYAVIASDGHGEYHVIVESRAGNDGLGVIVTPGTVAYVTTGGMRHSKRCSSSKIWRKISCFRSGTTCYSWCYYGEGLKVLPEAPPFLKMDPVRLEFYRATIRWEANDGSGSAGFVAESTGHQMSSQLLSMKSANALKLCLVIIRKETFLLNEEKV